MRWLKYVISLACLSIISVMAFAQADPDLSGAENHVVSTVYSNGRTFNIHYDRRSLKIVLSVDQTKNILEKIPKRFDPELVGADEMIGFLPTSLQPYVNKDVLVYISTIRTSGGDGRGQCGAGVEMYMNFLDVSKRKPKQISRILIGSCNESIELKEINLSDKNFGEISVVDGKLSLRFLFYKKVEGKLVGVPSTDFRRLIFDQ